MGKRAKAILGLMGGGLLLVLLLLGGAALYIQQQLQPMPPGEPVLVEIPSGFSTAKIAERLEDSGIIKNAQVYQWYLRYHGLSSRLQAGTYRFAPGETLEEITERMLAGEVYRETVQFTIPEGFRVEQIAERLAQMGMVDREQFLQLAREGNFPEFEFLREVSQLEDVKYKLEGYLFPDTYEVEKGAGAEEIVRLMLSRFERELTAERLTRLEEMGLTLHQWVTLSSMVEREAAVAKERPTIAGVFHNRLREGWDMEVDATVQYVVGQKERLTYADLEVDDPYNTYQYPGLPPGPIASPGAGSLEAVLYPEEHDYFFYVTKKDGSKEHYFAKTYEQHQKNIALSKR